MNNQNYLLPLCIIVAAVVIILGGQCTPQYNFSIIGRKPAPAVPAVAPKTRLLIFGFESCPACKILHRSVRDMSRDGWRVGPLPTDDIEEIDIYGRDERIRKYKHSSYPTLIIVDQSGKELARKGGAMSSTALAEWIQSTRE